MFKHTIGIDLGASYTKISYRAPLERPGAGYAAMNTEIVMFEQNVIIPSLVIKTNNRERPWLMGKTAAEITPGDDMKVFENWKSALYSKDFDEGKVELITVAGEFFGWLANNLSRSGIDLNNDYKVRVTIPALEQIEQEREVLKTCMNLHQWPDDIEIVTEPTANLLGILSVGRNVVNAYGKINYQLTFGDRSAEQVMEIRHTELEYVYYQIKALNKKTRENRFMKAVIVDLGSFTLDVAKLDFDLSVLDHETFPNENEKIKEQSWEIGIIDLDKRCFKKLFEKYQINKEKLSYIEKEQLKVSLYSGKEYALRQNQVVLGNIDDMTIIKEIINEYCENVWQKIESYCQGSEVVILTGGGCCIPDIHHFLTGKLSNTNVKKIIPNECPTNNVMDTITLENDYGLYSLEDTNEGMERLATCLGAASIGFGFEFK